MNTIDPIKVDFSKPIEDLVTAYKKSFEGISNFASIVNQMNSAYSHLADQVLNINKIVNSFLPDFKKITDFAVNMRKFHDEEKKALIESGWFICPSLGPVPYHYIAKAVTRYNSGRKDSITNLMKSLYGDNDWKYLEETIKKWPTHKFFTKQRMKIIRDAFEAHKERKYTLSIPALLPIIEGICGDFCQSQRAVVSSSATTRKAQILLAKIKDNGEEYLSELVLEFIEKQLYVPTSILKTSKNKKFLNRHGILHGSYSGYADCARSLRCFLMLDVLTLL